MSGRRAGGVAGRPWICLAVVLAWPACTASAAPAGPGWAARLVAAAVAQTLRPGTYDGSYRRLAYPGGDVPAHLGVCSDVVVRAYRVLGVDLQREVHEDMRRSFSTYPALWGLRRPDPNIDHRRVPNLEVFLRRRGARRPAPHDGAAYQPGDLVTWRLPGNLPHIGIVAAQRSPDATRPLIVHNIGQGPRVEDTLLAYPIAGRYRFPPPGAPDS